MKHFKQLTAGLLAMVTLSIAGTAAAQSFPNRPIKIIVNSPAGGGNDFIARTIAQKMEASMKQPVVVDNKPGAGGIIASDFVAKSAPDGYTILFNGPLIVQTAALYSKLPYDPLKDFTPLTDVIRTPLWLAVNTEKLPVKDMKEFVAYAKANPGKVTYGSVGSGSSHHLYGYRVGSETGTELLHVPYKGGAPAMVALVSGEVNAAFADYVSLKPHVASGKVRLLAVTGTQRPALTPDVPTLGELGFKGFESYGWGALFLPAKTPADVVQKLHAEVAAAIKAPDVAAKFTDVGFELGGTPPAQFATIVQNDYTRWTTLIKQVGVKLD
ncbi:Bug family tripartite tricarboxylate transporter substrate binding protein [Hydrogenophaga sp. BPS33]|uniref:Bug family tripartite tricarboxylate transporter substrate binding protein n=1 Tax=Hydrogenophaga sp. BPS33 TaxID=2651974 RepID=UPI00131FB542|nr:tripartite tricarboxylate transporter substrate binding protein [Hydrogenophaga sp. BPS33]QHE87404.1 tripartite tricarboxylate transporter substrate binding protein [Hydrogenophaga sp. BPS33]